MIKTTINIDGMACGMCEAHVCDAIRKVVPDAKKINASHGKKQATFITENEVDKDAICEAINATGYKALSANSEIYEKKGLKFFKK